MPGADTLGMPSFTADELYSTNITQESYAALSGAVLSGNPGTYTILLVPVSGNPQYDLMVRCAAWAGPASHGCKLLLQCCKAPIAALLFCAAYWTVGAAWLMVL
jgi:hypothetical protein